MADVDTEPDTATVDLAVTLTVVCRTPADVARVSETLARALAGFALDGHDAALQVDRLAPDD